MKPAARQVRNPDCYRDGIFLLAVQRKEDNHMPAGRRYVPGGRQALVCSRTANSPAVQSSDKRLISRSANYTKYEVRALYVIG